MTETQDERHKSVIDNSGDDKTKVLPPAAQRALEEAQQRRQHENQAPTPQETGGRGGADPARFGDWEINGRAIDF